MRESHCLRCQRLNPDPEASSGGLPVDWEVREDGAGNIEGAICPGCVTGSEEQAADEQVMSMMGECEKCGETTSDGIVVEGQVAGIYKVLAKVAGIEPEQAMASVTDHLIAEFGERTEALVTSGEVVELRLWVCGDCAARTGYKAGPMGTAIFREGTEGMAEVF